MLEVVTQALRRQDDIFLLFFENVWEKKKTPTLEQPAALNTVFTVGNVAPVDIHIQQGAKEAKKKENKKREGERDRSRMSMFPFSV